MDSSSLLSTVPSLPFPFETLPPAPSPNMSSTDTMSVKEYSEEEKKYFCQRCLNHGGEFPRKGHKSHCRYASCPCAACAMVEQRRQLNNMISKKKVIHFPSEIKNGRKVRNPKCARCYAHGICSLLRGHKKEQCLFQHCNCEPCQLVGSRRHLMAKQIKLRRAQTKERKEGKRGVGKKEKENGVSITHTSTVLRPIAVAPPSLILPSFHSSLSPSITSSISPSHSNSSFYSFSSSPSSSPPVPQLFHPLPHCPPLLPLHPLFTPSHHSINPALLSIFLLSLHNQFPFQ